MKFAAIGERLFEFAGGSCNSLESGRLVFCKFLAPLTAIATVLPVRFMEPRVPQWTKTSFVSGRIYCVSAEAVRVDDLLTRLLTETT